MLVDKRRNGINREERTKKKNLIRRKCSKILDFMRVEKALDKDKFLYFTVFMAM